MFEHRTIRPGDLTRARYERSLDERLHQELAVLTMRTRETGQQVREACQEDRELSDNPELIDALDDEALLERRITLLQMRLALPHR
jgi:transcription elongation GreA/GreB family factor